MIRLKAPNIIRLLLPPRRDRNDVIARSPAKRDDVAIPTAILSKALRYLLVCLLAPMLFDGCVSTVATGSSFFRYETEKKILDAPPWLQILLTEQDNAESAQVKIDSAYGIYQYEYDRDNKFIGNQLSFRQNAMKAPTKVTASNDRVTVDGFTVQNGDIVLVPINTVTFQAGGRNYRGYLRIKALPANRLSLINIIDMETYLPGVVSSEMSESWHENALAAQAITARSFAFYRIKQLANRKPTQTVTDYDLTDDMYSQVYKGEERTGQRTKQAVEQTRGIILSYAGEVFNCMFHGACGGATEPGSLVFDLTPIPPLQGRPCGFCYNAKNFNWEAQITENEIIEGLKLNNAKGIENIQPAKTAPGGHVIEIAVKIAGRAEPIMFNAQKFRIALNPSKLRSTLFKIERDGSTFTFKGRGWGHAVGMCQEGAKSMADQNKKTLEILEYYYPEARVVKIY